MSEGDMADIFGRRAEWCIAHADCRYILGGLEDNCIDAVVTDPPYELNFMARNWDRSGIAYDDHLWAEVLRVLNPGGHLVAFGGTRTAHRIACAIEDGGFEIRDSLAWMHGQGFPKSVNLGNGRGSALKPAFEPIILARKPLGGTLATNLEQWRTGALNIDACRVAHAGAADRAAHDAQVAAIKARGGSMDGSWKNSSDLSGANDVNDAGRWPPNVLLSHVRVSWYTLRDDVSGKDEAAFYEAIGALEAVRALRENIRGVSVGDQETQILFDGVRVRFSKRQAQEGLGKDHMRPVRDGLRGDTSLGEERPSPILLEGMSPSLLDTQDAHRETPHHGLAGQDESESQGGPLDGALFAVEGRQVSNGGGLHQRNDCHTGPGGTGPGKGNDTGSVHLRTPTSGGRDSGSPDSANRSGSPQEWGEGRQPDRKSSGGVPLSPFDRAPPGGEAPSDLRARGEIAPAGEPRIEVASFRVPPEWSARVVLVAVEGCERIGSRSIKANPTWDTPNRETEPSAFTGETVSTVRHAVDGAEEVPIWRCIDGCPVRQLDAQSGTNHAGVGVGVGGIWSKSCGLPAGGQHGDSGTASRYFPQFQPSDLDDITPFLYQAKPSRGERDLGLERFRARSGAEATNSEEGQARLNSPRTGAGRNGGARNIHPTVKSIDLMRWLVRLITPPGGIVLDCFCGSGSTGVAARLEGVRFLGIEMNDTDKEPFVSIARARLAHVDGRTFEPREELRSPTPPRQGALF